MRGCARALAAIFAPLALLGALGAVLTRPDPPSTASLGVVAQGLERRIEGGADVVLLGNSKVGSDVDPVAIAALFPGGAEVVALNANGTGMPVWYTTLHDRVYANGHRPRLVIVYGSLVIMAQAKLQNAGQQAQLAAHVSAPIPVLDEKVYGAAFADARVQRALRRRGEWRTNLTDSIRDAAVGFLLGRDDPAAALAAVFDNDANQKLAARRITPYVEPDDADAAAGQHLADTLIPDLVELAYAHGAQVLFVRSPLPSERQGNDSVPVELEAELLAYLSAAGAGYLDLRDADLSAADYGGVHLSRAGRARFTPQLVEALRGVGVGSGELAPAELLEERVPLVATRKGSPPAFPALAPKPLPAGCAWQSRVRGFEALSDGRLDAAGFGAVSPLRVLQDARPLQPHARVGGAGCTSSSYFVDAQMRFSPTESAAVGQAEFTLDLNPDLPLIGPRGEQAWWVAPGTTLTFTVPAGVVTGERRVRLQAAVPIEGDAPATGWLDGGRPTPLFKVGAAVEAVLHAPPTAGAWLVSVDSPADGPWLLVQRVVTGTHREPVFLIGDVDVPVRVDLLATPEFTAPPPSLSTPARAPEPLDTPGRWNWELGASGVPGFGEVYEAAGTGCTPLEVLHHGVPTAETLGADRKPLVKVSYTGRRLRLQLPDAERPTADAFTLRLSPARRCGAKGLWLYPGDEVRLPVDAAALHGLSAGADALELGVTRFAADGPGTLHASLAADGVEVWAEDFALHSLPIPRQVLPTPVGPDTVDLVLTLRNDGDAYVLLTTAALVEPARPPLGAHR
ncbi:MAG: hypothetical protein EXR71_20040 [Myxococcales bacterium]|nr:hypothetical protein [Myxococcales bacterium]